jgi:hypothetical protein
VHQLRDILRALDEPLPPPGGQDAAKVHRTAVRGVIGLSALSKGLYTDNGHGNGVAESSCR